MPGNKETGDRGERIGCAFLRRNGYDILTTNYRTRYGEIDVIAREGTYLVFVEIKYRRTGSFGAPYEAVHRAKQGRMVKAALHYIKEQGLSGTDVRFDVVSIEAEEKIELLRSAFTVPPTYTL